MILVLLVVAILTGVAIGHHLGLESPSKTRALGLVDWLHQGIKNGYCTPAYCDTHNPSGWTDLEHAAFERGEDPCIAVVRIYDNGEVR